VVDRPFRPSALRTGVLVRSERPEYGAAYRRHASRESK
jgi:2-oxoglutarate ferredoxin oxidoreductase subunit beta